MNYLLLALSVSSQVFQNALLNRVSKDTLKSKGDNYFFNLIQYISVFLIFAVISIARGKISLYTIILGAVFGILTVLASVYKISALTVGPLHITVLIITASMTIPALSGVFFGEKLSLWKLAFILALLFFIYLTIGGDKSDAKVNRRWVLFSLLAFILTGAIGVMQKIHQTSPHKDESASFLAVCFLISLIFSAIMAKKEHGSRTVKFKSGHYIAATVSGLCVYAMSHINLYLSGVLPSQIFFPLVNGASLLFTTLTSVTLFGEKFTRRQLVGMVGGFISLVAICLL